MDGAALPRREQIIEDGDERVRVFTREQLDAVLRIAHPRYRLFLRLLAATGLRWGEAVALRWRDLDLELSPRVKVRRAEARRRKGEDGKRAPRYKPPKSKYGRRDVKLEAPLARDLHRDRAESEWPGDDDLVFVSPCGTPLDYSNVRRRGLEPATSEAGVRVGRIPYLPAHLRLDAYRARHVDRAAIAAARPSLAGLHAAAVRALDPRRRGRPARPRDRASGCQ